ncbi:MAG: tetratricopeptide repeat protein [Treponema sp.]|nr:tetratricopeptide repeat protein [Treponema sp.]
MKKRSIVILIAMSMIIVSCRKSGEAEKLYVAALDYYTKNDLQSALNFVKLACKQDSRFYQAQFLESKIYFFMEEYDASKKIAQKLVKVQPSYTDARLWLIRCCIMQNHYEQAENLLARELSFNASDWRVYYLYSLLARMTQDFDTQLVMLSRAEASLSDSQKVYSALASSWELLGVAEKAAGYKAKHAILFVPAFDLLQEDAVLEEN